MSCGQRFVLFSVSQMLLMLLTMRPMRRLMTRAIAAGFVRCNRCLVRLNGRCVLSDMLLMLDHVRLMLQDDRFDTTHGCEQLAMLYPPSTVFGSPLGMVFFLRKMLLAIGFVTH